VVAEGVETAEAWRMLLAIGCDLAQGYLVSPPVTAAEVPQRLRSLNERLQTADTATQQLEALRAG